MKFSLIILSLITPLFFNNALDFTIITADGSSHSMNEFQGRKIMMVVLPSTQSADDSAYLLRLDSINNANISVLKIITVPSYEDGFTDDTSASLLNWYRSLLDSDIVITQGMQTHKASETQNTLFAWLTHTEQNGHFDEDITGPGQMYFINETGELYGVFEPQSKWSNKIITKMLEQ